MRARRRAPLPTPWLLSLLPAAGCAGAEAAAWVPSLVVEAGAVRGRAGAPDRGTARRRWAIEARAALRVRPALRTPAAPVAAPPASPIRAPDVGRCRVPAACRWARRSAARARARWRGVGP